MTLEQENSQLKEIARTFHWMARRYCDGRQSVAASLFNDTTKQLLNLGVNLDPGVDQTVWAKDGGGRVFDGLTDEQAAMGNVGPNMITSGELKMVADLLELASDEFSNHGCDDYEFGNFLTLEERAKLWEQYAVYNNEKDASAYDPEDELTQNWMMMSFMAHKLEKLAQIV